MTQVLTSRCHYMGRGRYRYAGCISISATTIRKPGPSISVWSTTGGSRTAPRWSPTRASSATASKADRWHGIRPGTDMALEPAPLAAHLRAEFIRINAARTGSRLERWRGFQRTGASRRNGQRGSPTLQPTSTRASGGDQKPMAACGLPQPWHQSAHHLPQTNRVHVPGGNYRQLGRKGVT